MATRFYLPSTGTPDITPAFDAGWSPTTNADRRNLVTTRINSSLTNKDGAPDAAVANQLLRQYISAPLAAQTLAGTLKGVMRLNSNTANVGMGALSFSLAKVGTDGTTVTQIKAVTTPALATSNVPPATPGVTLTNRRLEQPPNATFTITFTSLSISDGERLIIELGYKDNTTNTGRFVSINFGDDDASDLAENETGTTAGNPWIEFTQDITFASTGVTLTMSATEGADTAAADVHVTIHGALAATEGADTAAIAATVLVQAALSATEGADTAAISVTVPVHLEMNATEGADTFSASFSQVTHVVMNATEGADTAAISITVPVTVLLNATEGADVAAVVARVLVQLAMNATEGADTFSADLGSDAQLVMSATEDPDTFAAVLVLGACAPLVLNMRNPDLSEMIASAYLDRFGRFAKREEDIAVYRVFVPASYCPAFVDFTPAQYRALTPAKRLEIDYAPSAAGIVVTEGISSA